MYLFAFNYPNENDVVHNIKKLDKYIQNLIQYVKKEGSDEMKACFFASRQAYDCNDFRINLVAHSMGGLVSRYYIENLRQDAHVEKLITVDTPHWGSPYGNLSSTIGISHVLCDHDLHSYSAMNHGSNPDKLSPWCSSVDILKCTWSSYVLTDALQYQYPRQTKYYAIAGLDFELNESLSMNDYAFEMPTNFTTYQEVEDFLRSKRIDLDVNNDSLILSIGDNLVSFLSQIGWHEEAICDPVTGKEIKPIFSPIRFEKIFVDVDTNGGNGDGLFLWELVVAGQLGHNILHIKIPHRIRVCKQILEYLEE